jgi:hypothetical protein
VVSEIEAGWEIRGGQEIVAARVWEIGVLAWVTVGVRGRELEPAQAIVEGSVAVGEGVPSKASAAGEAMCEARVPAVLRAGLVVRVGEAPVVEVVVAPAAVVVAVVVVVGGVAVDGGKGLSCLSAVFRMFARRERRCAT